MESPLEATLGARMSSYLVNVDDFQKQRKRLNRQLTKLRHELNIVTSNTKNYKQLEKVSQIDQLAYSEDPKNGLLLLLTAERDLLHAFKIKALLEIGNDSTVSYKNLMVSKIKRSLQTTKKLLQITQGESDQTKRVELFVYAALIQGFYSITKKQWSKALNAFSIARCALEYLSSTDNSSGSADDEDLQYRKTIFSEILDSTVNPSLNLAILQDEASEKDAWASDLKLVARKHCNDGLLPFLIPVVDYIRSQNASFVEELTTEADIINSVEWRGHKARINNNEIAYKITKLNQDANKVSSAEQFDEFAQVWTDLADLHSSEQNVDEDDHEAVQERAILSTYINYNALFAKLKRDSLLIAASTKESSGLERSRVVYRLYNAAFATLQELKDLPGVYNDEELYRSLEILEGYFAAQKNYTAAEIYAFNEKYGDALVIFNSIKESLSSETNPYTVNFPYSVSTNEEYEQFVTLVSSTTFETHVLAQYALSQREQCVIESTDKYPQLLERILPSADQKIEPVLTKPVLFDIGYNYISYDTGRSQSAASATSAATAVMGEAKQKSGFFGIFGRS